jgi:hypothetical protein
MAQGKRNMQNESSVNETLSMNTPISQALQVGKKRLYLKKRKGIFSICCHKKNSVVLVRKRTIPIEGYAPIHAPKLDWGKFFLTDPTE